MSVWPEERLRAEIERRGRALEVETAELLQAFGVRRPTRLALRNIERALTDAGLQVEPPLGTAENGVRLSLQNGAPAAEAPPAPEAPATREEPPAPEPPPAAPEAPRPSRPRAARKPRPPVPRRPPPARRRDPDAIRAAAIEIVASHAGIAQRDLVERLFLEQGIARTPALAAVRALEREGALVSRRRERRKTYYPPEPAPRRIRLAALPLRGGRLRLPSGWQNRARRTLSHVLFVTGTLLLAEAAITVVWQEPLSAIYASRTQDGLRDELKRLELAEASEGRGQSIEERADEERLQQIRDRKQRVRRRLDLLAKSLNRRVGEGGALGRIEIPAIDSRFVLVQGTSDGSLRKGPSHYSATSLPGGPGTVGIAAHRTTYSAPFRRVDDLKRGNRIVVSLPYGRFTYSVTGTKIVSPDALDVFQARGPGRVVLTACHPLYSAAQRILVFGELERQEPRGAARRALHAPKPAMRAQAKGTPSPAKRRKKRKRDTRPRLPDRTFNSGMSGPDVRALQRLLKIRVTGFYGPETATAVRSFQAKNGLPADGTVGPATRTKLLEKRR